MKLLVLVSALVALLAVSEASYLHPYLPPCPYAPVGGVVCAAIYPPPHECGVPGTGCYGYHEQCCAGACHNECQVIHPHPYPPYPPHPHHPYWRR